MNDSGLTMTMMFSMCDHIDWQKKNELKMADFAERQMEKQYKKRIIQLIINGIKSTCEASMCMCLCFISESISMNFQYLYTQFKLSFNERHGKIDFSIMKNQKIK